MNRKALEQQIIAKQSVLCVGLDTDLAKIPKHLLKEEDPIFAFNKAIIDATQKYAVAYKPNLAFYEAEGLNGWKSLKKTVDYLNDHYPEVFTIADAKRGDIGNTAARYAKAFFEELNFDSLTVAPYMGEDSVRPSLEYRAKWTILLALTSNPGAKDFQLQSNGERRIFEEVLRQSQEWGSEEQLMYVVGATKAAFLKEVRQIVPNHFLLVPGVGAQGGSLKEVMENGRGQSSAALLINSSRGIIYAGQDEDFAKIAATKAAELQEQMARYL